jgi:peroxiredoxin
VAARYGLVFTLPDDLRRVYLGFGIDLPKANEDESWTLPMPARFVVDRDGVIRAAEADPDYTHRPEPADTLAVLRNLGR